MIFNSLTFLVFLVIVYGLYWRLDRRRQNILLLIASYVFYGWWDWRFLSLIIASSAVDYWAGLQLGKTEETRRRRIYLGVSLLANLGLLGVFKYFNFFVESFAEMLAVFGVQAGYERLNIILPVGISFYTFQTLSYTIDVYRKQCQPHRDWLEFFAFVAFFPQLVAGPIERARNLLGQFAVDRRFEVEQAKDGLRQMLWGFFQKVVIADGLADYVNRAYGGGATNGAEMLLGSYFFAFQIYCDFAGYSNIAIGCARLFGFKLMRNFAYPYFSRSIAEFWQRWHISLSTWFRDYLYIPLGGNRVPLGGVVVNVLITFTVSGLWHGANWTFVMWGFLNGLYFIPGLLRRHYGKGPKGSIQSVPELRDIAQILITFHLTLAAWIFFRSSNIQQAAEVFRSIALDFDTMLFLRDALKLKLFILTLVLVEWLQRRKAHALDIAHLPATARWVIYNLVVMAILLLGTFTYTPFIYFQF